MHDTRPREYATVISDKVTALIRELLMDVPKEFRVMVTNEALNSICIEWELKKSKARNEAIRQEEG